MKVAIIGGGISGLTIAHELLKMGSKVTLYEKAGFLGGQAGSFDFGGVEIEYFYHFICKADKDLFNLLDELGIRHLLRWDITKTAFFYNGQLYPFCNPIDLIKFKPISFISRILYGLNISYSKLNDQWIKYDDISAVSWLTKWMGQQAYDVLWHPLLKIKFGEDYDKISAAWLWHRIHRVASSRKSLLSREYMGYLDGGSQRLISTLEKHIKQGTGDIHLNSKVEQILLSHGEIRGLRVNEQDYQYDVIISTIPLPLLVDILPPDPDNLKNKLSKINFIGIVCMLQKLKNPVSENFWLNINDSEISFNGVIEYTNLNKSNNFKNISLVYIPFYLPPNNDRFRYSDAQLFEEYCMALKRINPKFNLSWVIDFRIFRYKYAQPICTTDFLKLIVEPRTEIKNFYLTDSSQLYPMDRCLSGMIGLAKNVVKSIIEDWKG